MSVPLTAEIGSLAARVLTAASRRCVGSGTAQCVTLPHISGAQHRGELCAITHGQVRRRQLLRPRERATVHPYRAQAGGACRRDIELGVVTDVGDRAGIDCELLSESLEAARVWLGDADLPGIERHGEDVFEPDACQIRVAVAE